MTQSPVTSPGYGSVGSPVCPGTLLTVGSGVISKCLNAHFRILCREYSALDGFLYTHNKGLVCCKCVNKDVY